MSESASLRAKAPARQGLGDRVYDVLKEALLFEEIEPGSRVNVDQVARDLGVSNTPVREALGQLEADGLVRKEAYRGYTALPRLDETELEEMYEFRLLVEPHLAALAAQRPADERVRELESSTEGLLAKASWPADRRFLISAANQDSELHVAIAQIAGNRPAAASIEQVFHRMRAHAYTYYPLRHQEDALVDGWHEHALILAAIRKRQPQEAAAAMESHLRHARERARDG